jgi:ABC-type branched-subunit amino acid transport system ATPase component
MIAIKQSRNARPEADAARQASGHVLMHVRGLRKAFGGQVVFDGVDLELREGEVVLLRGENGSGKTTLLNILTGNMEPDAGEIDLLVNNHPEHFHFPRHWWQELNPWNHFTPERVASDGVGRTWQDLRLFGSQTLLENLCVATLGQAGEHPWRVLAQWHRCRREEDQNRAGAVELLHDLRLTNRNESSADMISLGQCKRVAVARATRANAKILFLDEPLAGLDETGVAEVLSLLGHLTTEHRLTVVIVEHILNIPLILDFATTVWTLTNGRLRLEGVAEAKADPTVQNSSALTSLIRKMAGPDAVIKEEPLPRGATLTRVSCPGVPCEPLLRIEGLVARRGHRLVVGEEKDGAATGLDLSINKGELAFIQAPNGWGKTSLLEALAGILPCAAGSIELDGMFVEHQTTWERCSAGLVVVQARDNVFGNLTVAEYQRLTGTARNQAEERTDRSQTCLVSSLSSGERKRLAIEDANNKGAKVRVWDEPFGSLDGNVLNAVLSKVMPSSTCASLILMPSSHRRGNANIRSTSEDQSPQNDKGLS